MARKKKIVIAVFIVIAIFSSTLVRSVFLMGVHSYLEKKEASIDFDVRIPSGMKTLEKDWYPIMLWHHDDGGFSDYVGEELDMIVLYNFAAYDSLWGRSNYYNQDSPYYNSFYGAYILENKDELESAYGYDEAGQINAEEIGKIAAYDQLYLVLPSLGFHSKQGIFKWEIVGEIKEVDYIGLDAWQKVDAILYTHGPSHNPGGFQSGYWQYGKPKTDLDLMAEFAVQKFYTRIYARVLENQRLFCFYIICADQELLEETDQKILSKSEIRE